MVKGLWSPAKILVGIAIGIVSFGIGLIYEHYQLEPIAPLGSGAGAGPFVSSSSLPPVPPTKTTNNSTIVNSVVITDQIQANRTMSTNQPFNALDVVPGPNYVGKLPALFKSTSSGDDPLMVGFYLIENNPLLQKDWHWGDNTPDEIDSNNVKNHKYELRCEKWTGSIPQPNSTKFAALNIDGQIQRGIILSNSDFITLSKLNGTNTNLKKTSIYDQSPSSNTPNSDLPTVVSWLEGFIPNPFSPQEPIPPNPILIRPHCIYKLSNKTFNGWVAEYVSRNELGPKQHFDIMVNNTSFQMIRTFDQYEGVIIQHDSVGFTVGISGNMTSPYYTWMWGDESPVDRPSLANANPSHRYDDIRNYTGVLVVDSGYGNVTGLHEVKHFHVLVVSSMKDNIIDIEVASLSDPLHTKSEFKVGEPLWFSTQIVPYNPPPVCSGVCISQNIRTGWDFGDGTPGKTCKNRADLLCETNHTYTSKGIWNVNYSAWVYDKPITWNKTVVITAKPSIHLNPDNGKVNTAVTVIGSNFSPEGVTYLWCKNCDNITECNISNCILSNKLADVNSAGKFDVNLTVPMNLKPGYYNLFAYTTHLGGDVANATFTVTR